MYIGGDATPVVQTYTANQGNASGTSPWSFASVAIGTAFATRRVIIAVAAPSTGTVSVPCIASTTIGGIAGTLLGTRRYSSNNFHEVSFWYADVPTGTSITVGVTANAGHNRASMSLAGVWTIDNSLLQNNQPTNENFDNTASAATLTAAVTVQNGGFVLAVHCRQSGSGTCTWGGTGMTKVSDNPLSVAQPTNQVISAASGNYTTGSSVSVTVTPSAASATQVMAAIAMR